jgi:hypothetical protein
MRNNHNPHAMCTIMDISRMIKDIIILDSGVCDANAWAFRYVFRYVFRYASRYAFLVCIPKSNAYAFP